MTVALQGIKVLDQGPEKSKTKDRGRRSRFTYSPLTDKYKLVSVAQKRISGATVQPDSVVLEAKLQKLQYHDDMRELSTEELFDLMAAKEVASRPSLSQKLRSPSVVCDHVAQLPLRNKPLNCKSAWRCKACEHILLKMEFGGKLIFVQLPVEERSDLLLFMVVYSCNGEVQNDAVRTAVHSHH